MIAMVLLLMSEGADAAMAMSGKAKNEYLKAVKRWWNEFSSKRRNRMLERDLLWLLPASPAHLAPELTEHAYAEGLPVATHISVIELERLRAGSWMRIHPSKAKAVSPPQHIALQAVHGPQSAEGCQQMQMMQMMMTCFKELVATTGIGRNAARQVGGRLPESDDEGPLRGGLLRVYAPRPRAPAALQAPPSAPPRQADELSEPPVDSSAASVSSVNPPQSPKSSVVTPVDPANSPAPSVNLVNSKISPAVSATVGPMNSSGVSIDVATQRVLDAMAAKQNQKGGKKKERAAKKKGSKKRKRAKTAPAQPDNNDDDDDDEDDDDDVDSGDGRLLPLKGSDVRSGKATAATAASSRPKKAPVAGKAPVKVQHEKSRNQFLVRSVPSKQFKYGEGCAYPTERAAKKAAEKHAARQ